MRPLGFNRVSFPVAGGNPGGTIVGGNPAGTIVGGHSEPTEMFQTNARWATAHSEPPPEFSPPPQKVSELPPAEAQNIACDPVEKALVGSGISVGLGGALLQFDEPLNPTQ